jgi:hypothetical protein
VTDVSGQPDGSRRVTPTPPPSLRGHAREKAGEDESLASATEALLKRLEVGPRSYTAQGRLLDPYYRLRYAKELIREAAEALRALDRDAANERLERQSLALVVQSQTRDLEVFRTQAGRYERLQQFLGLGAAQGVLAPGERAQRLERLVSWLSVATPEMSFDAIIEMRLAPELATGYGSNEAGGPSLDTLPR